VRKPVASEIFIRYDLDLLVDHLANKPVDRAVYPLPLPSTLKSNKRFDLPRRHRFGKRPAFGFVQPDPLIDRLA
jgi:hypothetical protein